MPLVAKTPPGTTAIARTTAFTPDSANCRLTQEVVEPLSSTYKVTVGLGYDSFGNLSSQTITGINMTARTTLTNWGTRGQFPTSVTNPLTQVTQFDYNFDLGVMKNTTDPNLLVTSWGYDNFGRKTSETRPDGTSTTRAYNDCATRRSESPALGI
jgi:YD repeat-containing protein